MKYLLIAVLALAAATMATDGPVRFDNFEVYRVIPINVQQLETLRQLEERPNGFNFWTEVSAVNASVDIMVPPHMRYTFQDMAGLLNLDVKLMIANVQKLVNEEQEAKTRSHGRYAWDYYQTLEEIHSWLKNLPSEFPGLVSLIQGGVSYEGRKILGVKISFKPGNKGVFLEGGIHAREWIAPATVTYIANQLLTSNDPNVRAVAESRDWYVFPSVNPDGYVWTHKNDRMWRKTRQPYGACYGADPNRNWGYHWMDGGATSFTCSDTHAGRSAFSEVETLTLSKFINTIAHNLDAYIAFHSYSQLLLIPFGHNGLEVPENNAELHTVGENAINALSQRYGTQYTVGNIPQAIYVASGGSTDWVRGVHRHIRLTYTYELRDTGNYGFVLPPKQIVPTGEETLDSLVSMFLQYVDPHHDN